MKKLIAIICVLLAIFIGMYIYQRQEKEKIVTAEEVSNIEQYISKIYMWKEVTQDALPEFNSINEAPEKWVWEVVKKNLDIYDEILYDEIQEKAKEIFGKDFSKKFPEEGNDNFLYNQEQKTYQATSIELDSNNDAFLLNNIEKTKEGYKVELIEYIEDYSEENNIETNEETEYTIHIKNTKDEEIFSVKNTEGKDKIIEQVKSNIEKFQKITINLKLEENEIYITSSVRSE